MMYRLLKDLFLWTSGRRAEAIAHWGLVLPPPNTRKIFWIYTSAQAEDVALAAEILGAIRQKRLDLQLIFTCEGDYSDLLTEKFANLRKVAFGFSPHDRSWPLQNFSQRMSPFAWLAVHRPPFRHVPKSLPPGIYLGEVTPLTAQDWPKLRRVYPQTPYCLDGLGEEQHKKIAPTADLRALLVETEIDAKLKALLLPPFQEHAQADIWLALGLRLHASHLAAWQASPLAKASFLCVESLAPGLAKKLGKKVVAFSTWSRQPVPLGSILYLDTPHWLPGIIGAASGIHFQETPTLLWPYLAGGAAISIDKKLEKNWAWPSHTTETWSETLTFWEKLRQAPFTQRQGADQARKALWQARRAAQNQLQDLLNFIFDW